MQMVDSVSADYAGVINWREAIDSVGTSRFASETVRTLEAWAGVDHFSAFRLDADKASLLSAASADDGSGVARSLGALYAMPDFCRSDPMIEMAKRAISAGRVVVLQADSDQLPDDELRQRIFQSQDVCDRVFICGERDGRWLGLSMVRTHRRGRFNADDIGCIRAMADTWLSLIAAHERLMPPPAPEPSAALLGSVAEIEDKLRELMPSLTRRETQVCARILRGMSTPGIAIDLGLREDSVATYRKRAYRRLFIGTRFELIQRFITPAPAVTRH
jgi:DNA-binding CsgD family transcriptional regulator